MKPSEVRQEILKFLSKNGHKRAKEISFAVNGSQSVITRILRDLVKEELITWLYDKSLSRDYYLKYYSLNWDNALEE